MQACCKVKRKNIIPALLAVSIIILAASNLFNGPVRIPLSKTISILCGEDCGNAVWRFIVLESRLPQTVTAMLCGAALGICGLLLQTVFRNPLADPSILGISSGAALGAALITLTFGSSTLLVGLTVFGQMAGTVAAAFIGAMSVAALVLSLATKIKSHVLVLIVGIMAGYLTSSAITILSFFSSEEGIRNYTFWGMGSYSGVALHQCPLFAALVGTGIIAAVLITKPLGVILLGETYAESLGINTQRLRNTILTIVGFLSATTTAFCGPVSFIGLAVPHLTRMLLRTDDYRQLFPCTLLMGSAVSLMCNFVCNLPQTGFTLPLNAVTPLIGAPVVLYIIIRRRRQQIE